MADKQQMSIERRPLHAPGNSLLLATIAGVVLGGPLIASMGICFAATVTLLLVSSPLFILFSPLLFAAACLFGLVMLGFAVAAATAVAGMASVGWVLRSSLTASRQAYGGASDKMVESGGGYILQYHPRDDDVVIERV